MRRKEKELTDRKKIDTIIHASQICRLGLARDNVPYIVPVSFGYDNQAIYFHTAEEGVKIEFMHANNAVCFECEHGVHVIPNKTSPCQWSMDYETVIGNGNVKELTEEHDKLAGLQTIISHYSDSAWELTSAMAKHVRVWKIIITSISGKCSKN